jgi:hypothetical protein
MVKEGATGGLAAMPWVSVGLNLGMLPVDKVFGVDLDKLDVVTSFMSYNSELDAGESNFNGELSTFSLMFRYRFLEDVAVVPGKMVHWGGLHLHAGFRRSTMKASVSQNLGNFTQTENVGGIGDIDFNVNNMVVNFDIDNQVNVIPIEVSSYVRLAWAFTVYGGVGADIMLGDGKMNLTANGDMDAAGGGGTMTADISSTAINGSGDAVSGGRAFLGFQLNLPFVRLLDLSIHRSLFSQNDSFGVQARVIKVLW